MLLLKDLLKIKLFKKQDKVCGVLVLQIFFLKILAKLPFDQKPSKIPDVKLYVDQKIEECCWSFAVSRAISTDEESIMPNVIELLARRFPGQFLFIYPRINSI